MIPNYSVDEWRSDLKKLLLAIAWNDESVVLYSDQFRILMESQYQDLQCIMNNNISSDVLNQIDIEESLI